MIVALPVPDGYTRFSLGPAEVVARTTHADAVRQAVDGGSLYAYAAAHPDRRALRGRGTAYAVPLPGGASRVVVRHSRHGGWLAPLSGDRFLAPTRAPHELHVALRLADAGVPTPDVIAYAVYRAGALLRRSDVATREIETARDLADLLAVPTGAHEVGRLLTATAELLRALERAGARHPDLNLANVLIVGGQSGALRALVLDVDRVRFGTPGSGRIGRANLRRVLRSARTLRARGRIAVSETALRELAVAAGHPVP